MKRLSAEELRTLYAMIQRLEATLEADTDPDSAENRWTIRGVDREVRDIAVASAAKHNVTVGRWVTRAICRYADGLARNDSITRKVIGWTA